LELIIVLATFIIFWKGMGNSAISAIFALFMVLWISLFINMATGTIDMILYRIFGEIYLDWRGLKLDENVKYYI